MEFTAKEFINNLRRDENNICTSNHLQFHLILMQAILIMKLFYILAKIHLMTNSH